MRLTRVKSKRPPNIDERAIHIGCLVDWMNGCLAAWLPCLAIIMGAYFVSIELFFDRQTEIEREIWSLPKEFRGCTFDADADVVYCVSCLFIYSFVCLWISCYLNPVYILPQNDYIPSCWNRRSQPASDAQIENAYNSTRFRRLSIQTEENDERKKKNPNA